ncbi:Metallo-hydrolase/oxidoreductase [Trametes elegans]|nr:Metallo-hydrolase/oxidoreductase [Trametes elegans]
MSTSQISVSANLSINTGDNRPPTKDTLVPGPHPVPQVLKVHPTNPGGENATPTFVGTATTLLEWRGVRIMTDPNFLHAGDHVHLGPGVTAQRLTNPSHEDHFDKLVEDRLRRDLPIITTPHAQHHLTTAQTKSNPFTAITALDTWQAVDVHAIGDSADAKLRVIAMPGKHVPPGLTEAVNKALGAVPPTNGWMVELLDEGGRPYRIYISGDTLMVDELKAIPEKFPHVDLMLIHLGGTSIPGPNLPLFMVTMDAQQGIQLLHLINPDVTIPIHHDDYDVFKSPLKDFQEFVTQAGLEKRVIYLNRGDQYSFRV